MPKRSERKEYSSSFKNNPYEGTNLNNMYERLRWGNKPSRFYKFNAPEPMVSIGEVAKIRCKTYDLCEFDENHGPYLAIGRDTNLLYLVPKYADSSPYNVSFSGYRFVTKIVGIDYYSDKGGKIIYYYHDHEPPFPSLMKHRNGVCFIMPAITNNGHRSYVVDDAGIIG